MSWPADGLPRFKLVKTGGEFSILDRAYSHSTVAIFAHGPRAEEWGLAKAAALNAAVAT